MPATDRPRRSVLYMPGSNPRVLDKGRELPADALILDLEDSVAAEVKATARAEVGQAIAKGGYGRREIIVRVNGLDTPWAEADIAAAAAAGADAVLLPKVSGPEPVRRAAALLEAAGSAKTALWCMIETPRAVLSAQAIAEASPRMAAFVMGTSDLGKDLRVGQSSDRLPMLTALSLCLLAARATGLAALDGVHTDLNDMAGFEAECRQGATLGFDGKTLIHPKQIEAANRAFAPTEAEVAWSRRVIAAHAEAERAGQGVVLVDGKLVEALHVKTAQRLVALADEAKALEAATGR
jgi:citrate lyase subunit beta/citryl-CoA lyase